MVTSSVWRVAALAAALASPLAHSESTSLCPDIGLPVPSVKTLYQHPTNTSQGVVLTADCTATIVSVTSDPWAVDDAHRSVLSCSAQNIKAVVSYPRASRLELDQDHIATADFAADTTVRSINLAKNSLTTLDAFAFPTQLETLKLEGNAIVGLTRAQVPTGLQTLELSNNNLVSLANFTWPASLKELDVSENSLSQVDFALPETLATLTLDGNPMERLENFSMPAKLQHFSCRSCGIEFVRGVRFAPTLTSIDLNGSNITTFEVRASDVAVLKNLTSFVGVIKQAECAPPAKLDYARKNAPVCVLNDTIFDDKYPLATITTTPPVTATVAPANDTENTTAASNTTTAPPTSTHISKAAIIGMVCVAVAMLIAVPAVSYHVLRDATANRAARQKDYNDGFDSPSGGDSYEPMRATVEYLKNDIRNDDDLLAYRIPQDEIEILKPIAKGGFGVICLAKYRGQEVAVKQMRCEKERKNDALQSFMEEIRLCAKLDHPRIVKFVGVSWSTLLDMAVITEYMSRGDLSTILTRVAEPTETKWFEPSAHIKPKLEVALEVTEALMYLHSFDPLIIHRDLKARNVLMNAEGDAKLSDFGISREIVHDATMTGEVGTVAWIAPEVLQGERYSEKADIYSLGVLLVELDTCRHPYRHEMGDEDDSENHSGMRIAVMVSCGALRPSLSPTCPAQINELVSQCLSFDPSQRPSAVELFVALRNLAGTRRSIRTSMPQPRFQGVVNLTFE